MLRAPTYGRFKIRFFSDAWPPARSASIVAPVCSCDRLRLLGPIFLQSWPTVRLRPTLSVVLGCIRAVSSRPTAAQVCLGHLSLGITLLAVLRCLWARKPIGCPFYGRPACPRRWHCSPRVISKPEAAGASRFVLAWTRFGSGRRQQVQPPRDRQAIVLSNA